MALWTDPTRQYLINSVRNCPMIWDKNYVSDTNYRTLKDSAFRDLTDDMNAVFPMAIKFTCEDVRSQWRNLKDTFVRKRRWMHEGKYMEDAMKEPTWKFYRMLTFLEGKDAKRLGDAVEHTYELAPTAGNGHIKTERQPMLQSSSAMIPVAYEPTSTGEQKLQMFHSPPVLQQQQGHIEHQLPTCSSTACTKRSAYSPRSQNGSSSGVGEDEEEEEEPTRKRVHRRTHPIHQAVHSNSMGQDEFDHFGALVASHLRRLCGEQGRISATRVQKKLSDVLFSED